MKTVLHRIDLLLEHTNLIAQYEAKGISLMTPSAKEMYSNYSQMKISLIEEYVKDEIEKIRTRANLALSPKSKITEMNKALIKIAEWKNEYPVEKISEMLVTKEQSIGQSIHKMQLQQYIDEAEKALFMKQKNKALTKLREALYFIKTDMVPDDSQQDIILQIEKKILDIQSSNEGSDKD